jgi:hypothetical protein
MLQPQRSSHRKQNQAVSGKAEVSEASPPPAIRRIGRPAAVARRPALSEAEVAARRVVNRQMPRAYPPNSTGGLWARRIATVRFRQERFEFLNCIVVSGAWNGKSSDRSIMSLLFDG